MPYSNIIVNAFPPWTFRLRGLLFTNFLIQLIQTILHFFNLSQISRNPLPTFYIFDKKPGFLETRLMYINHVR